MIGFRKYIAITALGLAFGGIPGQISGLGQREAQAAEIEISTAQLANANLVTATVAAREIRPRLSLTAILTGDRRKTHRVGPVVDGIVVELHVVEYETVRAGQALVRFRSNALGEAQAEYLGALAGFRLAQTEAMRIEALWKEGVVAESRWLGADAENKKARAELKQRRRLLALAGLSDERIDALEENQDQLAEFDLLSPIDGIVSGAEIEAGQLLRAGEVAFHVDDLTTLWAEVRIPTRSLSQVAVGGDANIRVAASPGEGFAGRLEALGGEVDQQSQTLGGRIVVENPSGLLRPGMYAEVVLTGTTTRQLAVPESAVFLVGDQSYVFEVLAPSRFSPITVELGRVTEGWVPIHSGIAEGSEIVVGGVAELKSHWQYQGGE